MNYWWQSQDELSKALQARQNQNEGMARVCARRAAGAALQGFFSSTGTPIQSTNAYALLTDPELRLLVPQNLHEIMNHLVLRVDTNYKFPPEIDLLNEVTIFINTLKNISKGEGS